MSKTKPRIVELWASRSGNVGHVTRLITPASWIELWTAKPTFHEDQLGFDGPEATVIQSISVRVFRTLFNRTLRMGQCIKLRIKDAAVAAVKRECPKLPAAAQRVCVIEHLAALAARHEEKIKRLLGIIRQQETELAAAKRTPARGT